MERERVNTLKPAVILVDTSLNSSGQFAGYIRDDAS